MTNLSARIAWTLLGTIIGAYWLRVWRMARKAHRKTGRAANFIPAESLGRLLRVIWFPVVGIWIVAPFFSAATPVPRGVFRPVWIDPIAAWCGAMLAAICFIATIFCWRRMGRSWRMGIDPAERTELILGGPYSWVAHPIYAWSQMMMLATLLALPTPPLLVAGSLHVALLHWEARREERHMRQTHGAAYEGYRGQVGGFFPKWGK